MSEQRRAVGRVGKYPWWDVVNFVTCFLVLIFEGDGGMLVRDPEKEGRLAGSTEWNSVFQVPA
jgi:hypothetical protein